MYSVILEAMNKFSNVIISNRLPVSVKKVDGKLQFASSNGGLSTAMSSLEVDNKVWIGWPGIASDELTDAEKREIKDELVKHDCVPVFLTKDHVKYFYEGYSNDTIWPLFHYFQSYTVYNDDYWCAFREVNKLYCQAAQRASLPDATVWIHDYHLMLLPKMLRKEMPKTSIGFFLHIPFPSYEIFRLLPERSEVLEGLLGADLVGFHIYDYARHFLSSALRLLGISSQHGVIHYEGRVIRADAFPIGIDYQKFETMRTNQDVIAATESMDEAHDVEFTILSVDRLDYSKGIPERLDAFRAFLQNNPQYLGRVKLVMVAVPSRTEVETYKDLRDQIEVSVSRINGEYGTSEWAPISYQFQDLPFHEICALYANSDVMLVTPIRDGMNLVAKEYIASKSLEEPGVLILSEMAGAIDELPESLSVNPNDTKSIERAIKQALNMSKVEKRQRLETMQDRLREYTVSRWGATFFESLEHQMQAQNEASSINLSSADIDNIKEQYDSSDKRLIVLDYDGTLQTFKSSPAPSAAKPNEKLHSLIANLASQPENIVCILSGRKKSALEDWFGDTDAQLIAEHGAWVKDDGNWSKIDVDFEEARTIAKPIMDDFVSRTPNAQLEQKDFASVWHYRNVPVELAYVRTANLVHELTSALLAYDVSVHKGHKIVEVKPTGVDKGNAVDNLIRNHNPDFVLVAGDDYTDEDMFKVVGQDAASIKVGAGETAARHRVADVEAMHALLQKLLDK